MQRKEFKRRILAISMVVITMFGMTACKETTENGSDLERKEAASIKEDNQGKEETTSPTATQESIPAKKNTEYPLTITTYGYDGAEITTVYKKAPEKVLAVYQGSVETMLELGLEDRLVATAGLDNEVLDHQKTAFSKVPYLDEFTPSLETVTMLEPDLIFSWGSIFSDKKLGDAKGFVDKGVNIYINANTRANQGEQVSSRSLENEFNDILNIGKIFDVQDKAERIVKEMEEVIASTTEAAKEGGDKSQVLILESMNDAFTNYGAHSLGGDMLTRLGGELANPDGADMGKEDIITINPDVIFVVYMPYSGDDPEKVKQDNLNKILADEAFASLDAVKNNRVVPIMLSEMYASATRTKDGMEIMAKALYPNLNLSKN